MENDVLSLKYTGQSSSNLHTIVPYRDVRVSRYIERRCCCYAVFIRPRRMSAGKQAGERCAVGWRIKSMSERSDLIEMPAAPRASPVCRIFAVTGCLSFCLSAASRPGPARWNYTGETAERSSDAGASSISITARRRRRHHKQPLDVVHAVYSHALAAVAVFSRL